jgi:hypothetical protein
MNKTSMQLGVSCADDSTNKCTGAFTKMHIIVLQNNETAETPGATS